MLHFIANLRLRHKLLLQGGIALAIVAVLVALQVRASERDIAVVDAELAGLEPSKALLDVVRLTQQHRGAAAIVLGGKIEAEPQRATRQAETDQAMRRFAEIAARDIDQPRLRAEAERAVAEWASLSKGVAGRQLDGPQSFARHTALIASQIELLDHVTDHFGLTLDPAAATYFTIIATLQQMPRLTEHMGQARARGAVLLGARAATPADRVNLAGLVGRAQSQLQEMQTNLGKAFEAEPRLKAALGQTLEQSATAVRGALDLARKEVIDAETLSYDPAAYFSATTAAIEATFALKDRAAEVLTAELSARREASRQIELAMLGASALAVALAAWLSLVIARSITGPAAAARDAARRIAQGDLATAVPAGSRDEMGQLLGAMRDMQASLVKVVGDVRSNAESVATSSTQIAHGNADLSQRTEEQASALQQTAATMEQLGTTVKQNADNAQQANQLAQGASSVAIQGGAVVDQVVVTMKGISDSSRKIADIIGVIDGIAFQTNILALNAAVEAARAGEQGRGFAVVAGEVRTLAQRSAEAAKEIKRLITASVERVDEGTALVDQAGRTMAEVVAGIRRVTDIMGEISAASVEQNTGVQQVGQAIGQMDQVTQQNAALVEQSAAAAESLKGQARALVQTVGVFTLAQDTLRAAATATSAAVGRPGQDHARNVTRPAFGPRAAARPAATEAAPAKAVADGDWTSF
jgi:methyl-accepting chemotaxis protein